MRAITLMLALCIPSLVTAEITVPTLPTPPTPPDIAGQITSEDHDQENRAAIVITRMDSIRSAIEEHQRQLSDLKKESTRIEEELAPASGRNRVYAQNEVDQEAYAIRRSLPQLPESSRIDLEFIVAPDGRSSKIHVVSGPSSYTEAITDAVGTWLYVPAQKGNRRVPVRVTTSIRLTDN